MVLLMERDINFWGCNDDCTNKVTDEIYYSV